MLHGEAPKTSLMMHPHLGRSSQTPEDRAETATVRFRPADSQSFVSA
jgi:hypothetical protein